MVADGFVPPLKLCGHVLDDFGVLGGDVAGFGRVFDKVVKFPFPRRLGKVLAFAVVDELPCV